MKNIQDILKKKISFGERGEKKELDEKTLVGVFLSIAKSEIKNFEMQDIREIKIRNNILYIKTIHPVVSSELFLRRERISKEINKIAGKKEIERMIIS